MRPVLKYLLLACLAVALVLVGMRSGLRQDRLFHAVADVKRLIIPPKDTPSKTQLEVVAAGQSPLGIVKSPAENGVTFNQYGQLMTYPGRKELPRPAITPRTIVAFVFGQSNAANQGGQKYSGASDSAVNFSEGKFYRAQDPLLGAYWIGGSVWTPMANKLLEAKVSDSVILIPAAIGGSSVADWRQGGRLHAMFLDRLESAKKSNLAVTHFLWHQGEADNPAINPAGFAEYDRSMRAIIALTKQYFPRSKFFVARASRCLIGGTTSTQLQRVQTDLAKIPGVYLGPNTDEIGFEDRYDDCHLSASGLEKHSDGWVSAIMAHFMASPQ